MAKTPTYTATAEVVLDGKVLISAPIPVTSAGLTLIAHINGLGADRTFSVSAGNATEAGHVRLEKSCFETVTFYLRRDGEPFHQAVVESISQAITIDLAPIFP